jgi:DNA-binding transcriptional MerR regulator
MAVAAVAGAPELPEKPYFRIGEVAELVGVEPHVLRYWEREFRAIRPTKSAKGQRVYSRRDVENLLRVRHLLYAEGFTIAGAKKRLGRGALVAEETHPASEPPPSEPGATLAAAKIEGAQAERAKARENLLAIRGAIEAFLAGLDDGSAERSRTGPGADDSPIR